VSRILFVDDEPRVVAGLRRMLRSRQGGWQMRFVESAQAALLAMEEQPADVIVSDFRMPGMDGGQLLNQVRHRYPDTARLILSGHTAEKDLMRVITIAHQFLTKPCGPDELVSAIQSVLSLRQELDGEWIRAEVSALGLLPSAPSVLEDLMAVLKSPDCDAHALARVLQRDVALSAKVFQLANSSFFAPGVRTTSLEAAVVRLGMKVIRPMVVNEIMGSFKLPDGPVAHWLERLNHHALETARLATRLVSPAERDDAFCAAFLHECGQLVFAICRPGMFATHLRLRELDGRALAELEREAFGVTHAQAGAYLLSLWGFPEEVVKATAVHGVPPVPETPGRLTIPTAVQVAHLLVESERTGVCGSPGGPAVDDTWLEKAGILAEVRSWRGEATGCRVPSGVEAVAHSPDGDEPSRVVRVGLDLPPQSADVLGHSRRILPVGRRTPNLSKQLGP
jgi:HD-like signal output (HDOD) protein/CheY-like chemotaxis protein